jgi:hypothetical protein
MVSKITGVRMEFVHVTGYELAIVQVPTLTFTWSARLPNHSWASELLAGVGSSGTYINWVSADLFQGAMQPELFWGTGNGTRRQSTRRGRIERDVTLKVTWIRVRLVHMTDGAQFVQIV